jgi:hypothetical protein
MACVGRTNSQESLLWVYLYCWVTKGVAQPSQQRWERMTDEMVDGSS